MSDTSSSMGCMVAFFLELIILACVAAVVFVGVLAARAAFAVGT